MCQVCPEAISAVFVVFASERHIFGERTKRRNSPRKIRNKSECCECVMVCVSECCECVCDGVCV